jgi:two-component system, OmpR family, osmolarity sensor histidine kinase EnvZ
MPQKLHRLIIPQSLLGRTAWALFFALALAQLISAILFYNFVTVPRVEASLGVFVTNLKTITSALEVLPVEQHSTFIGRLVERDGIRILRRFDGPQPNIAPQGPALQRFRERLRDLIGPETEVFFRKGNPRMVFVRLPVQGQEYWVSFARNRIETESFWYWGGVGAAAVLLALGGSYLIVRRLNQPLRDLASASKELAAGKTPNAVQERGPAEVVTVTREFNRMSEALARQERERASFLAGVSHDLRTPLARLRLGIEMLPAAVDTDTRTLMVGDIEDMRQVIDQFLDFARDESSEAIQSVQLTPLLAGILENCQRTRRDQKIQTTLTSDGGDSLQIAARPVALRRMFANLIDNAAKYGGGVIDVHLTRIDGDEGVATQLTIADRGPGITESDLERMKQPFVRGVDARSGADGAGLGLAIAERIARMHGAQLGLSAREGGGLTVTAIFPS